MRFPGRSQHTGGRWLAAMAAQWLVDGSNSARRRRARAWPPQRAVGAKPPGSPERRERQETSSCRPGPGLPRLSGWERIQPFEFFSPGVGGKSLADKHLATCLPTASSERATELSADAVRPAELLPTPSRAVATRRAVTRRAIHSTSSGPARAVSVVRRCIANLLLLAVVAIVAAPLSAHAATLVSNDGKSTSSTLADLEQRNFAQAFTTGAGEFGYAVESVELDFGTVPRSGITSVSLWTVASGTPSTKLVDLSNPASFSIGRNTFTAPTGTSLEKQTTYFVVITASGGTLRTTSSNSEDSSGQSDWSIGNNALEEIPDFNITWRERDNSLKIVVNGTVKTEDTDDTDATLSALSLQDSGGDPVALSPTFNSSAETYTAWVSNSVAAVALTATKNSSGATVVITGDDNLATAGSATLDLDEGANTLTVTVTAADTMTMKTYTVALVREASAPPADPNAIWTANLTVGSGGGTLGDPSFGYHRGNSFGALAPRAFTYNSSTVTVEEFAYNPIPPSPELPARTIMDFTGTLAGGDYVLHLGAMSFPFSYDAIDHRSSESASAASTGTSGTSSW